VFRLQTYNKCSGTYAHVCQWLRVFIINNNNNNINSQVDRTFDYYCATVRGGCNSSSRGHKVNTRLRRYTSYIYIQASDGPITLRIPAAADVWLSILALQYLSTLIRRRWRLLSLERSAEDNWKARYHAPRRNIFLPPAAVRLTLSPSLGIFTPRHPRKTKNNNNNNTSPSAVVLS